MIGRKWLVLLLNFGCIVGCLLVIPATGYLAVDQGQWAEWLAIQVLVIVAVSVFIGRHVEIWRA